MLKTNKWNEMKMFYFRINFCGAVFLDQRVHLDFLQ